MSYNVDSESRLGSSYSLAEIAVKSGMMPSLIMKYLPGVTRRFLNKVNVPDQSLSFSRGFSSSWTRTHTGFKYSNILFKTYGNVSGDHQLRNGVQIDKVVDAFELAMCQFPELIEDQVCDISRFSCLLEKVVDHEYMISTCSSKGCKNKFIHESLFIRNKCWVCAEKSQLSNKELAPELIAERAEKSIKRKTKTREKEDKLDRELVVAAAAQEQLDLIVKRQMAAEAESEVKKIQRQRKAG
ncbi:hypothetical protein TUM3794_20710 [Shewanella colwelliana]|uniref:Transcriptional regulator n=1 Tax=Shewanella colwelliana TaxID=23 RepID=A0ABQ4P0P5_SHECO|nr:hypothetical protein [Shewanella colwelliana]GIU41082.1 hypothetical protein TUM3794_20710 [Shewanella colwelliana]